LDEYKRQEIQLTNKYQTEKLQFEKDCEQEQIKIQEAKKAEIHSYTSHILSIPVIKQSETWTQWFINNMGSLFTHI